MKSVPATIYFVIPCYNEEAVLKKTAKVLELKINDLMDKQMLSKESKVYFINDGSSDMTWNIICEFNNKQNLFAGINLAHNVGHQNALLAGLMELKDEADAIISMDADLQDDINAIDKMLEKYYLGNDIVYGVRSSRDTDTIVKKYSAEFFYKFVKKLGADIVYNHADYRLMNKDALNALGQFTEVNVFLRGIVPMLGFKSDIVYYHRQKRAAGESKYSLKKMIAFSVEGITSLTVEPIRIITKLGILMFAFSMLALIWSLFNYFWGYAVIGWTSIVFSLWALGGLILFSIGIVGEYIGKIYMETKRRPRFIIKEIIK